MKVIKETAEHYCPDWDGMLIQPSDPEFDCCLCWVLDEIDPLKNLE